MNRFIYLFILSFIVIINSYSQSSDTEVISKLNNYRKSSKLNELKHDSVLQNAEAKIFKSPHYNNVMPSDDSIRKYLRKEGCFDYNVKLIATNSNDLNETGGLKLKNKNLRSALSDPSYNSASSINVPETGNTFILLTKKYISVDSIVEKLPSIGFDNKVIPEEPEIILIGKTSLKKFYYQVLKDSIDKKNESIENVADKSGKYRLKIKGSYKSVIFKGEDSSILSVFEENKP